MSESQEKVFCPVSITPATIQKNIEEGRGKIDDHGELVVDLRELKESNTLTICVLIDLLRTASRRKCVVYVKNPHKQMEHLIDLYQLSPWIIVK